MMIRKALFTLLVVGAIAMLASTAFANGDVHYVHPSGDDGNAGTSCDHATFSEIQEALADGAVTAGDTVVVCEATYDVEGDTIEIAKANITLRGDGAARLECDGSCDDPAITITKAGVTVESLHITGFDTAISVRHNNDDPTDPNDTAIADNTIDPNNTSSSLILVRNADRVTVSDNSISGGRTGIDVDGGENHIVTGNTISGTDRSGIDLHSTTNPTIRDNTIRDIAGSGNGMSLGETQSGADITGNTVTNPGGAGIYFEPSSAGTVTINDNVISGVTAHNPGIQVDQDHDDASITVSGNVIDDTPVGLDVRNPTNIAIENNQVSDSHDVGVLIRGSGTGNDLSGNEVCGSHDVDIRIESGISDTQVVGNTFDTIDDDGVNTTIASNSTCPTPSGSRSSTSSDEPDCSESSDGLTIEVQGDGCRIRDMHVQPIDPDAPLSPAPPAGLVLPYGLIAFEITGIEPGSTVTVTIELPGPATEYWKFQNGEWFPLTDAAFDGNMLTLTLTDGGLGDASGVADGTIVDPGAPAVRASFTG